MNVFRKMFGRNKRQQAMESLRATDHVIEMAAIEPTPSSFTAQLNAAAEEAAKKPVEKTLEEKNNDLMQEVLAHGYEPMPGVYHPPADSMTNRHRGLVSGIIASLRIKEASLVAEVAAREKDLREVRFTLYGYECAEQGFAQIDAEPDYDALGAVAFASVLSAADREEAERDILAMEKAAESSVVVEDEDQVDVAPNPSPTAAEVIPEQEAAQQPIDFAAISSRKKGGHRQSNG